MATVTFTEELIGTGDCITNGLVAILKLKWSATDICGNSSELSVIANIVDETSPVFVSFTPEMTIGCNDDMPQSIATDNCGDVTMTVVDSIVQGDCAYEYDILRIVTAMDPCGNSTTQSQTIHVGNGSGPIIEGVIEVICDDLTIPEVTAFDVCAGEFVPVTMQQDTLDTICEGLVIQRTWTAVDLCGNVTVVSQIIIINDQTPPVITIPANSVINAFLSNIHNQVLLSQTDLIIKLNALNAGSVIVTDDCHLNIVPVFTVVITYAENCKEDGYAERRVYSWTATDVCGNSTTITFTVDIIDDTPPIFIVVPNDTTIICAPLPPEAVVFTGDPIQSVTIDYSETIVPGDEPGVFIVTRQWTATDSCGNTSVYVQHIKWIPDTFLECNIILPDAVECNSHGVLIGSLITGGLGPVTYHWEIAGEKCFIQGSPDSSEIFIYIGWSTVKIILTVTDSFGCVSMCMTTLGCDFSLDNSLPDAPPSAGSKGSKTDMAKSTSKDHIQQLNLWPNPANESLNLSFESSVEDEVEFRLMNFLGQVMLSDRITAGKGFNAHKLDVTQLPEGSYLMRVKTGKEIHAKVIVIMWND